MLEGDIRRYAWKVTDAQRCGFDGLKMATVGPRGVVWERPEPPEGVRKFYFELASLYRPWCAPKTAERAPNAAGDQRDHPKEVGAGEGGGGRRRGGGGVRWEVEAAEAN